MHPVELKNGVWWVGALDPQLRVFDIIMKADHGTTYNAYLVKGSDKTAVIDTNKAAFTGEYLDNIKQVTPLNEIDYIVVNHTEPDHSGALNALLAEAPQAKVVCGRNCVPFIRNILNRDVEPMVVGDGDTLDLGGKTLHFIQAPFLHWPDSIFTYLKEDTTLFPCDFLGAHYCDDRLFDDLMDDYGHAFEYYYLVIFRPFKQYVLEAIEKIKDLEIDLVCPSHGPMLRSDPWKLVGLYKEWSSIPAPSTDKTVLVFYASAYGNTASLAEKIADGLRTSGVKVQVMDIAGTELGIMINHIEAADGLVVGSTTINADAVEPVWNLLSNLATLKLKGKLGASFGSYGWSGEGSKLITERLRGLKFKTPLEPYRVQLVPTEEDLAGAVAFGKELAANL